MGLIVWLGQADEYNTKIFHLCTSHLVLNRDWYFSAFLALQIYWRGRWLSDDVSSVICY